MKLAVALLAISFNALAGYVTVTDTIRDASGRVVPAARLDITPNSQFQCSNGDQIYRGITAQTVNGVFSVSLCANDTATPASTSYSVRISPQNGGQTTNETWVVDSSPNPAHLFDVRTSPTPIPSFTVNINQLRPFGASGFCLTSTGTATVWASCSGSAPVDIRNYGAICNGSNQNTAVQAAITAGNLNIYIPSGCVWIVPGGIIPGGTNGITYDGENATTSIIESAASPSGTVLQAAPGVVVRSMNIQGSGCTNIPNCQVQYYANMRNVNDIIVTTGQSVFNFACGQGSTDYSCTNFRNYGVGESVFTDTYSTGAGIRAYNESGSSGAAILCGNNGGTGPCLDFINISGGTVAHMVGYSDAGSSETSRLNSLGQFTISGFVGIRSNAVTLSNGANQNVGISGAGYMRVGGPTSAFSIGGLVNTGAIDGRMVTIYNATAQIMTIKYQDSGSSAANRIFIPGGADYVCPTTFCTVNLIYDSGSTQWICQTCITGGSSGTSQVCLVTRTSSTVLTLAAAATSTNPCILNGTNFTSPITATISANGGTSYIYASGTSIIAGYGGGTFAAGNVVCSGCTATLGITSFPNPTDGVVPIWTWTATSGTWDVSGGTKKLQEAGAQNLIQGTNVTLTKTSTGVTIASTGGAPGGSNKECQYNNSSAFGGITSSDCSGTNFNIPRNGQFGPNLRTYIGESGVSGQGLIALTDNVLNIFNMIPASNGIDAATLWMGPATTSAGVAIWLRGGVQLVPTGSQYTCAVGTRGMAWYTPGAAGVKDKYEVCGKDAADVYAWRAIY